MYLGNCGVRSPPPRFGSESRLEVESSCQVDTVMGMILCPLDGGAAGRESEIVGQWH